MNIIGILFVIKNKFKKYRTFLSTTFVLTIILVIIPNIMLTRAVDKDYEFNKEVYNYFFKAISSVKKEVKKNSSFCLVGFPPAWISSFEIGIEGAFILKLNKKVKVIWNKQCKSYSKNTFFIKYFPQGLALIKDNKLKKFVFFKKSNNKN
jgi:hypothetical protein